MDLEASGVQRCIGERAADLVPAKGAEFCLDGGRVR